MNYIFSQNVERGALATRLGTIQLDHCVRLLRPVADAWTTRTAH